ncbi:MAG: adenosine deaminase [Candidatus Methylomirabilis oxygeniifera]|uniref:Adenine deaminase n=1 Tax=Methylomirabilis oxygeniifera TaxID=671143 RepID=D5MMH8_METO1|nr:MAG: adenosine deaminase [Candidatus Methylomirabilis oxyfera]CBE70100.1 Adenosine deaminase (Adenosine aminohydrolase) [Candidatus Methylomirabilis oxyfera]
MSHTNDLEQLIRDLPKAELHVHIEGTLEPELLHELARRNHLALRFATVEELRRAYRFHNLQSFLDIYYEGVEVLLHEQDFFDLTWAYLERAAQQHVRHTEIFFDPQAHTDRGVPFDTVIRGIHRALEEAIPQLGISSRLIMCFLRHLEADTAMLTLEASLRFKNWIVAVGLDSSELNHPPNKFVEVFERARAEGYLTVAHAGEEGPPDYIRQALDLLHVSRLDHGVRCLEDPALIQRLARERIPLTVCPLSNVKLCVFKSLENHNLKKLLDLGLCVTVNSDDPAYFGGYITENLLASQKALGLTRHDIYALARNAFEASFLRADEKRRFITELDRFMQAHPG